MAEAEAALYETSETDTAGGVLTEIMVFLGAVWIAFIFGVVVGWAWKPKWVSVERDSKLGKLGSLSTCKATSPWPSSPSSSISSPSKGFGSLFRINSLKLHPSFCDSWVIHSGDAATADKEPHPTHITNNANCSMQKFEGSEESFVLPENDLKDLYQLVEMKDGGPSWIKMMDRSTPTMGYQAWRRDPPSGPPQYRSRTVLENATPEMVRDFFWDNEFRPNWDDMLLHSTTLKECPTTGSMLVRWIRKFPFFCSDREYIIGRRIWDSERSYYCVTKGVPCSSIPRCNKPRRVDQYYSSWCIRAVESKRGDGLRSACEVILFHHEDMGIPWEIAKIGVRQGMWGAVKKIEPGFRAYEKERASDAPLSGSASMAQISTKTNLEYLRSLGSTDDDLSGTGTVTLADSLLQPASSKIPKILIIGGTLLVACSIDHGLLTKAAIFGVARRFAKVGKRL